MENFIYILGILGYLGLVALAFGAAVWGWCEIKAQREDQKRLEQNDRRYRSFIEVVTWCGSAYPILGDVAEFTKTESYNPGDFRERLKKKYPDPNNAFHSPTNPS